MELIQRCIADVPAANHPDWIRYNNDNERKWAFERFASMPRSWQSLLIEIQKTEEVSQLLGVELQSPEQVSRGGGIHLMFGGGVLGSHLDYALHPSGLERRANLILFLDDVLFDGGALILGDNKRVQPMAGEAVVWECGDNTFHGVERLHKSGLPRLTAACYFLAPPRPNTTRTRALFTPQR
jgi:hypothetical protein